jgi:hypothetical protein
MSTTGDVKLKNHVAQREVNGSSLCSNSHPEIQNSFAEELATISLLMPAQRGVSACVAAKVPVTSLQISGRDTHLPRPASASKSVAAFFLVAGT